MSTANELIDSIKHRLDSRENIYPAINKALRLINKRLFYHGSDLVTGALSQTVVAGASTVALPSDFWGLRGLPYISGYTTPLRPLSDKNLYLIYTTAAVPLYYEVRGQTLYLIPGSSSLITILGDYWQRPARITAPTDTIPYFEQFDDAICEFIVEATKSKPRPESDLQKIIILSVDEIAPQRDMRGEIPFPDGTDWNYLANG